MFSLLESTSDRIGFSPVAWLRPSVTSRSSGAQDPADTRIGRSASAAVLFRGQHWVCAFITAIRRFGRSDLRQVYTSRLHNR